MTINEIKELARAIHDDVQSGSPENRLVLQGYSSVQDESNLFPVNEIEDRRLWKMARCMWFLGRAYERLYAYENNLMQE